MEAGPQANQQSDQRIDSDSATEAYSEADEEECTSRGKTPDTNVKLNQPLRCGRYGQDLISHKERQQHSSQAEADREQGQKAGRLGAGGKVGPALIASRQSTTAPPAAAIRAGPVSVAQPLGKGSAPHTVPQTVPLLAKPSQQPATVQPVRAALNGPVAVSGPVASGAAPDRAPPGGPSAARAAAAAPASVDDLLTGPSPVLPIMTASMAGEAAAMVVSAAALAKPAAANNPAVKAVLGQHYRQYRAKMAAAEQRNAIPPRKPQGATGTPAPAKAAAAAAVPAAAESANRGSQAGPSGQQRGNALPDYRQHRSQSHAAAAQESQEAEDVPLRVKYGSSSSGSSSGASWQVSAVGLARRQDTASTLYAQAQQPQQQKQPSMHDKDHQRPSKKGSRNADLRHGWNSMSQQAQQDRAPVGPPATMRGSQSTLVATEGRCQLPGSQSGSAPKYADPEDVETEFFGSDDHGVGKEQVEDARKSNDKLDMLLYSTVKRTQQGVLGKENQVGRHTLHIIRPSCHSLLH